MATIVEVVVFGGALAATVWAMFATIRPRLDQIVDLLKHGPVATPALIPAVAARSSVRDVKVRSIRRVAPLRAAA